MLTLAPRRFTVTLNTKQGRIVFDNKDQGLFLKLLPALKGEKGDSAYQVALSNGFVGDEAAWLASLESTVPGPQGISAYQVALNNGFVGSEAAWLASLEGEDGADSTVPGPQGISAYQVALNNGFVGSEAAWLASLEGEDGADSTVPGPQGISAYQVALNNGFVGSEAAWLASLEGADGADAPLPYRLYDSPAGDYDYEGIAPLGTAQGDPLWKIRRHTFAAGVYVTTLQAVNVTWTGRAGHTYT